MKKILLVCICLLISIQNVFADDLPSEETSLEGQTQTQTPVVVDITQLLNNNTNTDNTDDSEIPSVVALEPELVNVTQSQQRITASDTTGFKSVILSLMGDYETTITDYEYRTGSSGYTSHSINIERDWSWICSCGIFAILLICTFKTIGTICSKM